MDKYIEREKKIIKTSILGILANIMLVAGKLIVGLIAQSISIIGDAVNNLTDAVSSIITIIGTKLSSKKPNKKHPYGYGRIEYVTSLVISAVVFVAGATAIYEAVRTFIDKKEVSYSMYTIIVVGIAVLVKVFLGIYYKKMGQKYDSENLKASGSDALMDALLSFSTFVVALLCFIYNDAYKWNLEAFLGIIIGLFIVKTGVELLMNSVSLLIGKSSDRSTVLKLKKIVQTNKNVKGVYDVILNNYGPSKVIGTVHIEVDDDLTAKEIHRITREIQAEAYTKLGIILTVGIYASNNDNDIAKDIKSTIAALVNDTLEIVQYHGFYFDEEKKLVTFDVVFDFDVENQTEILDEFKQKLCDKYQDYSFEIIVDNNFLE